MATQPPPSPRRGSIETYDRLTLLGRRWFWRARHANGEIVASGEPYNSAEARDKGIAAAASVLKYGTQIAV